MWNNEKNDFSKTVLCVFSLHTVVEGVFKTSLSFSRERERLSKV